MIEILNDYFATEDGRIWSNKTKKYVVQRIAPKGYYIVNLSINGKCKTFQVHRLIAKAFIPNPENYPVINHIDGNKLNNNISNLEWCSYQHNTIHAEQYGLTNHAIGKNSKFGRFSEEDIRKIRELGEQKISQYKIAKLFNVTRAAIENIINGTSYKWVA